MPKIGFGIRGLSRRGEYLMTRRDEALLWRYFGVRLFRNLSGDGVANEDIIGDSEKMSVAAM